ncbi:hypothetical protein AB0302_02665 [Micrococcus sp. NPDC078436]|uniref:hypothetical protein n=1 Tax=Micrococcus sp. NPDC078436 TaxID=3154960 RepID=UPI00344F7EDA
MTEAHIVDAVRTPVGRQDLDSAADAEVLLDGVDQPGPQAMHTARHAWRAAGLSEDVPGTTVERL